MSQHDLIHIMATLDRWVKQRGNGDYVPGDWKSTVANTYSLPENFGIQQNRAEIAEFAKILLEVPEERRKNALEIGLGYFGSTHFLWRMLFGKTTTIEYQQDRIMNFGENTRSFFNRWVLNDNRSSFLFGKSNDVSVLKKAYDFLSESGVDMLFIDGDHRYEGVMADFLLYEPLVKKGGIVAFHDCVAGVDNNGVPRFLTDLLKGRFGRSQPLYRIVHSSDLGIAYYTK